jgi:hypothetical protein
MGFNVERGFGTLKLRGGIFEPFGRPTVKVFWLGRRPARTVDIGDW